MEYWTIHIPIPLHNPFLWLGLSGLSILIAAWLVTHWPYTELRKKLPILHERPMTNAFVWFAALLFPLWLALITLTLWGTFSLWFTEPPSGDDQALAYRVHYLALVGLMTALAALIGAPLAVHRLYTVERQTKAQEEGLITDRINKAVEGLGAEKTVQRIGRPVTVLHGKPGTMIRAVEEGDEFKPPAKSLVLGIEKSQPFMNPDSGEVEVVDDYEVRTWPHQRTDIQWRDEALRLAATDAVTNEGEWQVFNQTVPNLEVRIGAIYALERIAQDSLRDHIQIMEILCAYIRENAKAADVKDTFPEAPEWFEGEDENKRWWKGHRQDEGGNATQGVFEDWRENVRQRLIGIKPRADIQTALTVIGRRSRAQKEKEWGKWRPIDEMLPVWPDWSAKADGSASDAYRQQVETHQSALRDWRGLRPVYRLDLRDTDLRGADMSGVAQQADFSLARFEKAQAHSANFMEAQAQGANFLGAEMQDANFSDAKAQGACFIRVQAECANFSGVHAQGAYFIGIQAQGVLFVRAQTQYADFSCAQAQGANFSAAHAQSANFAGAQAQGTSFVSAQTQGANFFRAQAQGASFKEAQAQGTNFTEAQAQGASFERAAFSSETTFTAVELLSAEVKACDFSGIAIDQAQINKAFGDESTHLPRELVRPVHWPN